MLGVAMLLALAAPDPSDARVLVLELEAVGVDRSLSRSVDPVVLTAAAASANVIAQSEMKTIASVQASKAEIGCDSSSCLAELAGAMGARFVLFGSVSKLGDTTTITVSMFDNTTAKVTRDSLAVVDLGLIPKQLPPKVRALVASAGLRQQPADAGAPP
ncbi:MAG TPA: hypothetical protein VGO62_17175, partial [Myxococcota bacterium]